MLKRTLYFTNPYHLSFKQNQLVAKDSGTGEERTVPVEDIGFVVLESMQISISLPLIEALVANNVAVVFCNAKHMPQSLLLNLDGHHAQTELFRQQIDASAPLKKSLWKQTVEAKIINQATLLKQLGREYSEVLLYAKDVKSGDPENREGTAARIYWNRLFGENFSRDRYGVAPNDLLNYGYIVLRAAVARALVGSGLLPTFGIHHRNKYNAYCLADDVMEPYRPYVDRIVLRMYDQEPERKSLEKEHKAELLKLLTEDVMIEQLRRPLMIALSITTASLAGCFSGELKNMKCPVFQ
ncbi:MAG: type II CRISPR-associated endonuclease Cas1 [Bacteroidetes bacterium]|nr:type II CRISPR-associated endonuclease Cas1 [Bacteroidota bacterium]